MLSLSAVKQRRMSDATTRAHAGRGFVADLYCGGKLSDFAIRPSDGSLASR